MQIIDYIDSPAQAEIRGKFVQFIWAEEAYLVFAPKTLHRFHVDILKHFLDAQHILYHQDNPETLQVDDANLKVLGGGKFLLNSAEQSLRLFDNSLAYGRFVEAGLIQKIAETKHQWSGFKIDID
ncbi:hypothetical protein [Candidatus Venteria ishoeyi]|uniref:Uncharacterized protein n=1 Tax=Candidatus Venteria ishoeyi TaxID=1899563 RepID=A0A1H6FCS1_9GAMM|nr:hypothetical protein [Candidatus Venteria ishoeyi]MDM8547493.1 hypothetical protein [Candidatus Venteria ishoeyi]SEH06834.1 Uncharacterised protein [Candidatus Venteria ishoeyi]